MASVAPSTSESRRARGIWGALVVLAALVRLSGVGKDLWLDEVWSLRAATELSSSWSAFTMHHEINHHLNTLWLYFLGPNAPATLYHLPSFLLGVAAVGIAGAIGFRRGPASGVATAAVFALSYEMVLYSSEARGYSGVVFATLLAFYALEPALQTSSMRWRAIYWIACLIGILSHPIFASFLAAAIVWTGWGAYAARGAGAAVRQLLLVHAVPVFALALLWFVDLRFVVAGGGTPANSLVGVYGGALAWAVAAGRVAGMELVCCVLVVAMLASAVHATRKGDAGLALFFVSAIVVFPIALVLVRGSDLVYTRHFLIAGVFTLLLFGLTLGRWWTEGRTRAAAIACAAFAIVNGYNIATLAREGRGQYRAAIEYMAASTGGDTVTIAGDHDFRIGMEMSYYIPRAETTKRVRYVDQANWPAGGPEWIVTHNESWVTREPEAELNLAGGFRYSLAKTFPTAPLSGLHWYLYHRAAGH
jgi:hypothetical protein